MAEALARHLLPSTVYIASAGVRRGENDPFVEAALDEIGLSLGKHHPKTLEDLEDDYFDLIITLAPEAHHQALDLTRSTGRPGPRNAPGESAPGRPVHPAGATGRRKTPPCVR